MRFFSEPNLTGYPTIQNALETRTRACELAIQAYGYEPEDVLNSRKLFALCIIFERFIHLGGGAIAETLDIIEPLETADEIPSTSAVVLELVKKT